MQQLQRPTGITVLAISILVIAAFRFIISFLDMAIGSWLTAMAMSPGYIAPQYRAEVDAIGDLGFWIGLFGMIVAGVMLIAVRGLWSMSGWGWWMTLFALALGLVLNLIPMFQGTITGRLIAESLFYLVFLVYLFMPHVRAAFSPASADVSAPA
ncbi:MAG TPA: hypothetical protein VFH48_35040 [Chloroflexota bacterium]|nr:hypothetical protein [Chloroflexota bacterium]